MKKINLFVLFASAALLLAGCKKDVKTDHKTETPKVDSPAVAPTIEYAEGTTDEALAGKIKEYLVNDYMKNDLAVIPASDRKFQFKAVDLNNDGHQEVFINFFTPYFCGSGGCTLLLLDDSWKMITKFTVTTPPIMIEPHEGKEWATLLVKDNNEWKELNYKNGKYPGNPSVLPKAKVDAPSGHAEIVFSEKDSPAKTFDF